MIEAWWQELTGCDYCSVWGFIPFLFIGYMVIGAMRLKIRWARANRNNRRREWTEGDTFIEWVLWPICFDDGWDSRPTQPKRRIG